MLKQRVISVERAVLPDVTKVVDSVISCPCHGSQFSAFDGTVKQGPATQPLAEQKLTVDNGTLKLGESS